MTPAGDFVQVAALPLTIGEDGVTRVLLLTSRETKRWVIPKGWPMKGRKPYEAAAQEALEEAGVTGQAKKKPIGTYTYFKRREAHFDVCRVDVYLLVVKSSSRPGGKKTSAKPAGSRSTKPPTRCKSRVWSRSSGASGAVGELAGQGWFLARRAWASFNRSARTVSLNR